MPLNYHNNEADQVLNSLYQNGFTQEGVDRLYSILGLGTAPRVPAGLIGNKPMSGRAHMLITDASGKKVGSRTGEIGAFLNTFGQQAQDPYREYGVGNYLGLAGMAIGAAGAGGAFNGIGSATGSGASGYVGGATAGGASTASGAASNLGIFANGGVGGIGSLGAGNAGALAASGGIAGGAGIGSALGGLGSAANLLGGGGGMGWGDWADLGLQLAGSYFQGQGAKDASRASEQAALAGIAEQRRQFDTTRADQMPWLTSGTAALNRLNDPNAFTASPSYGFVRQEALNGVQNSASARGGLFSGNAGRALQDRAANVASQEYGNWFNQNASLAGLGQASAQSLGALGQNNANNVSNLLGQQGDARASGIAGQTNALTGGISDLLGWWNRRRGLG